MTLQTVSSSQRRAYVEHEPKWQRFQSTITNLPAAAGVGFGGSMKAKQQKQQQDPPHPYQRQYSHVYHQRLSMLGPICWRHPQVSKLASTSSSGDDTTTTCCVKRILDLKEGVDSLVVGTLVREPGDDDKNDSSTMLHPDSHCRSNDALYLEDESGRVVLQCKDPYSYPMGIVVAVRGTVGNDGVMDVEVIYPPNPVKEVIPGDKSTTTSDASVSEGIDTSQDRPYLLLVSGLNCGDSTTPSIPRDMLLSYLEGRFDVASAANVAHMIIAGGLVSSSQAADEIGGARSTSAAAVAAKKKIETANRVAALRDLDGWIMNVAAAGVPVDIIPGKDDPTTANWPQRPLHRSLLPQSHRYFSSSEDPTSRLIHKTPNPYAVKLNGKDVVGTDGTNTADLKQRVLKKCTGTDNADVSSGEEQGNDLEPISDLDALRMTLQWSHICPTGPDSVPTAPHAEFDPMVLPYTTSSKKLPDLYFCGSASQFATSTVTCDSADSDDGAAASSSSICRLICVPDFSKTGQAVLVHLNSKDLKVELLHFSPE